jgi:protein-S-isoprenylcysteine O-methyltransferase Ste14
VDFARKGRGTLSPVDPPKELVVQGLYRYVRNPMYLSVSTIVWRSFADEVGPLFIYWVIFPSRTCS